MSEVHAHVIPPKGKHYGTYIGIETPEGPGSIKVWLPLGAPSDWHLAPWGVTREGWDTNVEVADGWGGKVPIQEMLLDYNHYQSRFEAEVVKRIAAALDGMEWDQL